MTGQFKLASHSIEISTVTDRQSRHGKQNPRIQRPAPRQQGLFAAKAMRALWVCDDLAQELGAQLGVGALLQRPVPARGTP